MLRAEEGYLEWVTILPPSKRLPLPVAQQEWRKMVDNLSSHIHDTLGKCGALRVWANECDKVVFHNRVKQGVTIQTHGAKLKNPKEEEMMMLMYEARPGGRN